jgi:F0F1-type ATP synthase membrane subunit b/b'
MVNQNVQCALKKYTHTTNKDEKTQKQIKWAQRGHQQIPKWNKEHYKKEIYELKKTAQNIKEELNKDMENSEKESNRNLETKKSPSQTKNTVEGHSSRLE